MSEKNESFGLGSDLYVRYDVCLLLPANHEQSGWSKRELYPALGCCNQLQPLGLLRSFQERKRYSPCGSECTRYRFWSGNSYYGIGLKGTEETGFQSFFSEI